MYFSPGKGGVGSEFQFDIIGIEVSRKFGHGKGEITESGVTGEANAMEILLVEVAPAESKAAIGPKTAVDFERKFFEQF